MSYVQLSINLSKLDAMNSRYENLSLISHNFTSQMNASQVPIIN